MDPIYIICVTHVIHTHNIPLPLTTSPYPFKTRGRGKGEGVEMGLGLKFVLGKLSNQTSIRIHVLHYRENISIIYP